MATMVGNQKDIGNLLNHLIELGLDAIEAYVIAVSRTDDLDDKAQFEAYKADHERQVQELQSLVTGLGEEAATHPDLQRVLQKGKVLVATLIGDRLTLLAMKTIDHAVLVAYERVIGRGDLPAHVREVLVRFSEEEKRHVANLEQRLIDFDETEKYDPAKEAEAEGIPTSREPMSVH